MKLNLVAVHYDTKVDNIVGFRLLDPSESKVMDVPYAEVMKAVKNRSAIVAGLEIYQGKLHGSNGSLDRYTKVVNGRIHGKKAIVIMTDFGDGGYKIADWDGQQRSYREKDILKLVKSYNIANGKAVTRENGRTFISSISGSFDGIEQKTIKTASTVKPVKAEVKDKVETKNLPSKEINTLPKTEHSVINKNCTCKNCINKMRQTCVRSGCTDIKLFAVYMQVEYPIEVDVEVAKFIDKVIILSTGGSNVYKVSSITTLDKFKVAGEAKLCSKLGIVIETKCTIEEGLSSYRYSNNIKLSSGADRCIIDVGKKQFEWIIGALWFKLQGTVEIKNIQSENQFYYDNILAKLIAKVRQSNSDTPC